MAGEMDAARALVRRRDHAGDPDLITAYLEAEMERGDEIARLSHRILVMAAGRLAGELPAGADGERIGRLAFESREAVHA